MDIKLKAGDRVNEVMHGPGKVMAVGTNLVAVMFDNGESGFYASEVDTRMLPAKQLCPIGFNIRATNWSRLPEVYAYAAQRGVKVEHAIEELVNSGLSYRTLTENKPLGSFSSLQRGEGG